MGTLEGKGPPPGKIVITTGDEVIGVATGIEAGPVCGKLTEEQSQRFIECAISKAAMLEQLKVKCLKCGRVVKQTRLGKLWHWLTCWVIDRR